MRSLLTLSLLLLFQVLPLIGSEIKLLGPFGGDVRSITVDPNDPEVLFAATADGQIFETENAGAQWNRLEPGIGRRRIVLDDLHINPQNTSILYAGGWAVNYEGGGLFKSSDRGKTWEELLINQKGQTVTAVALAPSNPDIIVVGTLRGVFRSKDAGRSWDLISESNKDLVNLESIVIDPIDPDTIYGGTWHLPYKTTDGGKSWRLIDKGMIEDSHVFTISIDPKSPKTLFAGACSGIYKSTTGALRWEKLKNGLTYDDRRTRVSRIDPLRSDVIYIGTTRGLFVSKDAGHSWTRATNSDLTVNAIAINPRDSKIIYLATEKAGILKSTNGGLDFKPINAGFIHRTIAAVEPDPTTQSRLYAGVVFGGRHGGVFRSDNGGESWTAMNSGIKESDRDIFSILISKRNSNIIYVGTNNGIYKSTNRAETWSKIPSPALDSRIYDLKFVSQTESDLIVATEQGLYRNSSAGGRWTKIPITGYRGKVLSVALAKQNPKFIYAATENGIYATRDGGKQWVNHSVPEKSIHIIQVDPSDPALVYVGSSKGLYRSEDGGKTWQKPPQGVYEFEVSKILINPQKPEEIWTADLLLGSILLSNDRGKNWHEINLGRSSGIWALALDPFSTETIYTGTISDGVCKVAIPNGHGR